MSNNVATFNFNNSPIRVVEIDGNPWFVVKDVMGVLSLDANQVHNHLRPLDDDEKMTIAKNTNLIRDVSLYCGRASRITLISESGLYKLVMRSDKPQAKAFQDWVAREVLPSIRKTGAYVVGQPSIQENPDMDPLEMASIQASLLQKIIAHQMEQRAIQREQSQRLDKLEKDVEFSRELLTVKEFLPWSSPFPPQNCERVLESAKRGRFPRYPLPMTTGGPKRTLQGPTESE